MARQIRCTKRKPRRGLVTCISVAVASLVLSATAAYASGQLDPDFSGGIVTTDLGSETDSGADVTVQPDGKIITVGTSNGDVVVLRHNPDGSLDDTFGNGGVVTKDLGANDAAGAIALQPTGHIFVAARSRVAGTTNHRSVVLRLHADGAADTSFGNLGEASVPLGVGSLPRDIFISRDGSITVSLCCYYPYEWRRQPLVDYPTLYPNILRFDADGRPLPGMAIPHATGIAMQEDDKLIVAVTYGRHGGVTVSPRTCVPLTWICTPLPDIPTGGTFQDLKVVVMRFLPQGLLDPTFGRGGIAPIKEAQRSVTTPSPTQVEFKGDRWASSLLAAQPGGGIILAFTRDAVSLDDNPWTFDQSSYELLRLHPDGAVDPSYGTSSTWLGNRVVNLEAHASGAVTALAVSGLRSESLRRLLANGAPDTSFGSGGYVAVPEGGTYGSIATQPDGKIVIAGASGDYFFTVTDISLARYLVSSDGVTYTLQATTRRDKGNSYADLSWTGSSGTVDVYRNGAVIASISGTSYTDFLAKARGTFVYKVCGTSSSVCSNEVSVSI